MIAPESIQGAVINITRKEGDTSKQGMDSLYRLTLNNKKVWEKPSYKDLTADFAGCLVSLALDKLLQKIEHKIYVKSQNKFLTLNKNQSWENSLQNR